ncbi:MAG: insulinase family protein [Hyphomicrobium sp.]
MSILANNPSGRLYRALVDDKKAAAVISQGLLLNDPGMAILGAILNKNDSMEEARRVMLATIDNVVKEPPAKEEVDRARTRWSPATNWRYAIPNPSASR